MLAEGASFRLVDALIEVGQEGATREHLLRKAELSAATFYKHLKPLISLGLIKEQGSRYFFPLDSDYGFKFKAWRDLDRLYDLDEKIRSTVLEIKDQAVAEIGSNLRCLWLVGSTAKMENTKTSDLDFLAITLNAEEPRLPTAGLYEIQWVPMDQETFGSKLRNGDEFAVNTIRHGILLHDAGEALKFYTQPIGEASAAFFQEKALVVERFRSRFFEALAMADTADASKELASMAQTVLRIVFQRLKEQPAGKPDLRRLLEWYFGSKTYLDFCEAIFTKYSSSKENLVRLHRSISSFYENFVSKSRHLERIAESLLRGQPFEFDDTLRKVLFEIFEGSVKQGMSDYSVLWKGKEWSIYTKSISGPLSASSFKLEITNPSSHKVLIVNSLRDVPLLERTFSESLQSLAQESNIVVLYSIQIVRAYHILHLEEASEAARQSLGLFSQIAIGELAQSGKLQGFISDALGRLEVSLDHEDFSAEIDTYDFGEPDIEEIESFFIKDPADELLDLSFSATVPITAEVTFTEQYWDSEDKCYIPIDQRSGTIEEDVSFDGTFIMDLRKDGSTDPHVSLDLTEIVLTSSLFVENEDEDSEPYDAA